MLPSEIPLFPTHPACERVSYCVETSLPLQLPPQNGSLALNPLSLFWSLYFALPYFEEIGLPFWILGFSATVQKLFCGSCSTCRWSFDVLVGEKVVSHPISLLSLECPLYSLFMVSLSIKEVCANSNHKHFSVIFSSRNFIPFISVQFSWSVVSDSLQPHESQHTRPPCPSPTPTVYSNSCPSSWWCHPAISSLVVPFSCPQSLPASGSFPKSQLFVWGSQSIGVSATGSVLPRNTQDWSPLGWTGWISLQSKGLSSIFYNTTAQKHQFFSTQLSSQSNSHNHTWPLENHSLDQTDLWWQCNVSTFICYLGWS